MARKNGGRPGCALRRANRLANELLRHGRRVGYFEALLEELFRALGAIGGIVEDRAERLADGDALQTEFCGWYGNHGLFYIPADDITLAVWVLDLAKIKRISGQSGTLQSRRTR